MRKCSPCFLIVVLSCKALRSTCGRQMDLSPIRALALGLSSAMGVQSDPVHKQVGVVLAIQNIIGKKEERTIACQAYLLPVLPQD